MSKIYVLMMDSMAGRNPEAVFSTLPEAIEFCNLNFGTRGSYWTRGVNEFLYIDEVEFNPIVNNE